MKTKTETKTEAVVETVGQSQSNTLRKYRAKYQAYAHKPGSLSLDNGDAVALLLRVASLDSVLRAADKLAGTAKGFHKARYAERNVGSQRMNAGNVIRGSIKRGDSTVEQLKAALK